MHGGVGAIWGGAMGVEIGPLAAHRLTSSEALDLSEERVCVETAFSDSALPLLPPATNPPVAESPPPPLLLPPPPLLLPPPLLPHPHPSLTMDARDS